MSRPESLSHSASLLPYLHPFSHTLRLVVTEGATDASYPFAIIDDSAPFSRVVRGSFVTDAGSALKDVFLILQRDQYHHDCTEFSTITNRDIEASWQSVCARTASAEGIITLAAQLHDNGERSPFAPLMYCREKQLFLSLLCPSCAQELVLCRDDELLKKNGLHPYSSTIRRYLYCVSCSSSDHSEFFVREREGTDPYTLANYTDLIERLQIPVSEAGAGTFPCAACVEKEICFGPARTVRNRLLPFSFFPFHLLMVDAATLNALDFTALLSGACCSELSQRIDHRMLPGRVAALSAVESAGAVRWTHFTRDDDRSFPELLLLKLSLLEEIVRRVAAGSATAPRGERVWVCLPKLNNSLPLGWNFRLIFLDDFTPMLMKHEIERNPLLIPARAGLLYFQVLIGSRDATGNRIEEMVRRYLSGNESEAGEGASLLNALADPSYLFMNSEGIVSNSLYGELWDKACLIGVELLNAARLGKGLLDFSELHFSLKKLIEETRSLVFSINRMQDEPIVTDRSAERLNTSIHRVVTEMIAASREEIRNTSFTLSDDRFDEVVETVILRSGAPPEPMRKAEPQLDEAETVIISSVSAAPARIPEPPEKPDDELLETVLLSPHRPGTHAQEPETPRQHSSYIQQTSPDSEQDQDDLGETVMIIPPASRHRPGGTR